MSLVMKSPGTCSDTTLPFAERDGLLFGTDGGVHLFDLARSYSFSRQAAPVSGDVVRDLARDSINASIQLAAGVAPAFSGSGIDFTGVSSYVNGVVIPNAAVDSIAEGAQEFLICGYFKLPTLAQWFGGATLFSTLVGDATANATNTLENHLALIHLVYDAGGGQRIWMRRQKAPGAVFDSLFFSTAAMPFGEVAQLSVWRKAGVFGGRVRSATKSTTLTTPAADNSTAALGSQALVFGRTSGYSNPAAVAPYRLYRGFVENLAATGRDPSTVLEADWARVAARAAFS